MLDKSILDNNLNDSVSYQEFLKSLGYGINEKIYLRLFDDSKTNKSDHGSKLEQDLGYFDNIVSHLRAENAKRRGVYFVVNGGGQTDKEVMKHGCCRAQFFEIDDLSFTEQIDKINEFIGKTRLEPSIIIKTKKSLHCYFLLKDGDISRFRYVQEQLIAEFKSDENIKNESRVMRLYGFNHCKQEPPTLVKLIKFDPDLRYTQDDISRVLPPPTKKKDSETAAGTKQTSTGQANTGKGSEKYYNKTSGDRTATLVSYIGHLKGKGNTDQEIKALVIACNSTYEPPLSPGELEREVFPAIKNLTEGAPNIDEPLINGEINKGYFHHWSAGKVPKPTKPFDSRIRDFVPKRFNIIVFSGIPWIYVNGKWLPDETTAKIRAIVELFLFEEFKTDTYITRICNLILHTAAHEKTWKDVNKQPKTWVNFRDCYLDLMDLTEHEHNPDFYTLNQIELNWQDIKAARSGKETNRFIEFAIPDKDDREMLLEYFGYALTADNRQQKALFLWGDGNTGKSTIMNLEKNILGDENISDISFQDMSQRFKPSRLVGKLANICGDLPTNSMKDSSTFKQITGNDAIDAERKNKDGFSFVNYAKMIFSTNGLPIIEGERSTGTFRRLLLISFQQTPKEIDPLLPDKLNKELFYFCHLIIFAANRMYQRGYILESENSKRAIAQLRQDSDVTQAWLDECTKLGSEYKTKRQDICASFDRYCEVERRTPLKPNSLYAALRAKGFIEYRTSNERGFKGIFANLG